MSGSAPSGAPEGSIVYDLKSGRYTHILKADERDGAEASDTVPPGSL